MKEINHAPSPYPHSGHPSLALRALGSRRRSPARGSSRPIRRDTRPSQWEGPLGPPLPRGERGRWRDEQERRASDGRAQQSEHSQAAERSEAGVRVKKIISALEKAYPNSKCALNYSNPLELLVATILSAQCTDLRVNQVTQTLFKKYWTVKDYVNADPFLFEREIQSTGFYRMKAKSILGACRMLVERFGGKVPKTMEELIQLPGVGRKTANVILGNCFRSQGIVVDTHVKRIAHRLGLTNHTDPDKIEHDLMPIVPKKDWTRFAFLLIDHGRAICKAPTPLCFKCPIHRLCPYPFKRST